jgi:tRNA A-37 threonylcarbamoyl transferase component Bud32
MNIMNAIHHYEISHSDLSNNNMMLHFLTNKSNVVYIGLCDLGKTRHMQKVTLCLYVFAKEQNIINKKKVC